MNEHARAVIEATFYLPDGTTLGLAFDRPQDAVADAFDGDGVCAAIAGARQGRVRSPEFKILSQRAGRIGDTVWIAGRHVTCAGRRGETHVDRFPNWGPRRGDTGRQVLSTAQALAAGRAVRASPRPGR